MTTDPPAFIWPLPGHTRITGGFNARRSYGPHNAIDVPAPLGTPYLAIAAGRVLRAGRFGDCGITVQLALANGWRTHVCHLSAVKVRKGHRVRAGQVIGHVGSTGDSTGPHAHINLFAPAPRPGTRWVGWVKAWAVNPSSYISTTATPPTRHYTVVSGDNASTIAYNHGLTWRRFKALNPNGPRSGKWRLIYPGERFRVA